MTKGIVDIRGKEYQTVPFRVQQFREECPIKRGWGIATELVKDDGKNVLIKATIMDPELRVVAEGYAEEVRGSSPINKTSAVENCETSAIGRALAAAGFGGESYASADEVGRAIEQQEYVPNEDAVPQTEDWKEKAAPQFDALIEELVMLENSRDVAKEKYERLLRTGYSEKDWRNLTPGSAKTFYAELEKMVNVVRERVSGQGE